MLTNVQSVAKRLPWTTFRSWGAYAALPLVGIITAPILARALGPEGRGQLAAVLQPLTVADAFVAAGVPAAMTFFVARGVAPSHLRKPAAVLLGCSILIVALVLIGYSGEIARSAGVSQHALLLLWSSAIIGAIVSARRGVWQGLRQFGMIDTERLLAAVTRVGLIVMLFSVGITMSFPYAVAYISSGLLASLVLFRKLPQSQPTIREPVVAATIESFSKYSLLASLGTISVTLNNRLDQAALPAAVSPSYLGFYSVAVTVAEVPLIIAAVMNRNLLAEASGGAKRADIVRSALTGMFGVILICAVFYISAPWLVPLAFGHAFTPAVPILHLLLIGTVLGSAASAMAVVITGRGRPGLGSVGPGMAAIVTVVLLFLYWPIMTVEIAAYVAITAQTVATLTSALILATITYRRKL